MKKQTPFGYQFNLVLFYTFCLFDLISKQDYALYEKKVILDTPPDATVP